MSLNKNRQKRIDEDIAIANKENLPTPSQYCSKCLCGEIKTVWLSGLNPGYQCIPCGIRWGLNIDQLGPILSEKVAIDVKNIMCQISSAPSSVSNKWSKMSVKDRIASIEYQNKNFIFSTGNVDIDDFLLGVLSGVWGVSIAYLYIYYVKPEMLEKLVI
jgi:hypothetical protein